MHLNDSSQDPTLIAFVLPFLYQSKNLIQDQNLTPLSATMWLGGQDRVGDSVAGPPTKEPKEETKEETKEVESPSLGAGGDKGKVALSPHTPPPRKIPFLNGSADKTRHRIYKSKKCGNFCWDCKMEDTDLDKFKLTPCIPIEFKVSPNNDDEVHSPRKGEAETFRSQVESAKIAKEKEEAAKAHKLEVLKQLQLEEIKLCKLLAKKKARDHKGTSTLAKIIFDEWPRNGYSIHFLGSIGIDHHLRIPLIPISRSFPSSYMIDGSFSKPRYGQRGDTTT